MKHYLQTNCSIQLQFEQIYNYLATAVKTMVRKSKLHQKREKVFLFLDEIVMTKVIFMFYVMNIYKKTVLKIIIL